MRVLTCKRTFLMSTPRAPSTPMLTVETSASSSAYSTRVWPSLRARRRLAATRARLQWRDSCTGLLRPSQRAWVSRFDATPRPARHVVVLVPDYGVGAFET